MKDLITIELEVTDSEVQLFQMSLGFLISTIQRDIDSWENSGDKSLDILCAMYDKQFAVMSVWRKLLISAGVPDSVISGVMSDDSGEGEEGEEE